MKTKIRFVKALGKYKEGEEKAVTKSDAAKLTRLGLAEIVEAEGSEVTGTTRALTTAPRGRPSKSEQKRLAAQKAKEESPPPPPEDSSGDPELDSSGDLDDSSAAA